MSTTTIWNLLNDSVPETQMKRGIKIPMIQRDYAQGRNNTKANEIRQIFLNNIKNGIKGVIQNNKKPLELDFIYGYIEADSFVPLDGQQRLTTLFLLHWYFAFKEGKLRQYSQSFRKFTYQTRQSSEEYIKKIALELDDEDYNSIFENNKSFEEVIKDKNWYFISWDHDLTIQSMITMLDSIHNTFNTTNIKLENLIDPGKPAIVFNFLDIENFGLSDSLYIKMNARGKPLNNFENLKAELGRYIEMSTFNDGKYNYYLKHSSGKTEVSVEQYFVTRIDTEWSDYFWKLRNEKTFEFDDKLLNLLANVSLLVAVKEDYKKYDETNKILLEKDSEISFYKFNKLGLLNEESIISYIDILDLLVSKNETIEFYLNEPIVFDKSEIISKSFGLNITYESRILFYGIYKFILHKKTDLNQNELIKWERLIYNLTVNTIYNDSREFRESIIAIDQILSTYNGDIYGTFLNDDIKGFDGQQIREEKLKIKMLLYSDVWTNLIIKAEGHPYLEGQIISLLSFSGIYDSYINEDLEKTLELEQIQKRFNEYLLKFDKLFNEEGLIPFENELFRRALLAEGDYLLFKTNNSFVINGKDRDISWKRLLKETGNRRSDYWMERVSYFKNLLDKINIEKIDASLTSLIEQHNCKDWRKDFIENPILLKLSKKYFVKFYEDPLNIYILRKTKYSPKYDPELKSILLKGALIKKGFKESELKFGFSEVMNQYGLLEIKNRKPKVIYNPFNKEFIIRRKGKFDKELKDLNSVVEFLVKRYK